MKQRELPLMASALILVLAACQPAAMEVEPEVAAIPAAELGMTTLPVTTESDEAKSHYLAGLAASDAGRFEEARDHFGEAVAVDPVFASGYLGAASTANSYSDFVGNLQNAMEHSAGASEAEQALIMSFQKGFESDDEGALAEAMKVTGLHPDSPRAWLNVAQAHAALGDYAAEREAARKILEGRPGFLPAYFQLANSYVFNEPRDFAMAEQNAQMMVDIAPEEQYSHDVLGDVHRAQGNLEAAHAAYTKAAEIAPDMGSPLQQRGHVNSFMGNWEEARADYDRAIELSAPQVAANFGIWRGLVAVHEGKAGDAIAEYEAMIAKVDEMDVADSISPKINFLDNIAVIATHVGMHDEAAHAIERSRALRIERLEATGAADHKTQESFGTYFEGMLAARRGDYAVAREKAAAFMELVAEDTDPQKDEPAHEIMGLAALLEGDAEAAVEEYEQTAPADPYAKYHLGLACEAAGDGERASEIFGDLAAYNFNAAGYALIRADVLERTSG